MICYRHWFKILTLLYFLYSSIALIHAQNRSVKPSPYEFLGFSPGQDRTIADWQQITSYFSKLDRSSNRIAVQTLGETTLKRPLIAAFISSPENILKLSKYQGIQRRLADPRTIKNELEKQTLIRNGRAVVVISCSLHSTEIVASQMSMQLAYELANANDTATLDILRNVILILIPSANPDGIDIVANWYRQTLGTPYEGISPPELYHHYAGHDNNRDWFMLNLKETQALTRLLWKEWFPQIVYDIHQQDQDGPRLILPPFHDPFNPNIDPLILRELGLLGYRMAADVQAAGYKGVVTNAVYDTWWHGGFRTAPYYHNSIGLLSEAASVRLMSPINISREDLSKYSSRGIRSALQPTTNLPDPWYGGLWRAHDIMNMEMITSKAVLHMAAKFRSRYLQNFYDLGLKAINSTNKDRELVAYLIEPREENLLVTKRMIESLIAQGIEVYRLEKSLKYRSGDKNIDELEAAAKSFIIFLSQPYRANIEALFERQTYPKIFGNNDIDRPYDVAGWTLPMQMGVEVKTISAITKVLTKENLTLIKTPIFRAEELHNPIKESIRIGIYKSWKPSMDEGWTRFIFDTFRIQYQSIRDMEIRKGDLRSDYDVIILPSQRANDILNGHSTGTYPDSYTGGIGEEGLEHLRSFVEKGGTLICFDSSSELVIRGFKLPVRNVLEDLSISEFFCPGSILKLEVETNHPITKGIPKRVNAYFTTIVQKNSPYSSAFEITDSERAKALAFYADQDLLQSGWIHGEERIKRKAALVEVSMGKGKVILFGFRPQHRGQTWGTFQFIFNAINEN
jgi:hypothetical protein